MRHDIRVHGPTCSARPVDLTDAEFIVEVRTPERSRYMQPIDPSAAAQRAWLERYFERPDEYYFIIERHPTREREALSCLLTPDPGRQSLQWGRFIVRAGSRCATEAAVLMHRVAFDVLGFDRLWGDTVADNTRMLAYLAGVYWEPLERIVVPLDGRQAEGIRMGITRERWRQVEDVVIERARRIAAERPGEDPSV